MNPTTPEVRQNTTEGSDQFGAVAVKAGDDRWLVANPLNGGHWTNDAEVAGWTVATVAVDVKGDGAE